MRCRYVERCRGSSAQYLVVVWDGTKRWQPASFFRRLQGITEEELLAVTISPRDTRAESERKERGQRMLAERAQPWYARIPVTAREKRVAEELLDYGDDRDYTAHAFMYLLYLCTHNEEQWVVVVWTTGHPTLHPLSVVEETVTDRELIQKLCRMALTDNDNRPTVSAS